VSTHLVIAPPPPRSRRQSRAERREERHRLERCDTLTARLAELHAMNSLLQRSVEVVSGGWIQGAWFTVATRGGTRVVAAHDVRRATRHPVVGACLVGGIVEGGGGPTSVRSQLVRRTLDLTWHTLHEDPREPVRWCPGPDVRLLRLLDLTRWNDAPGRTQEEVVDLLVATRLTTDVQRELCRAELSGVGIASDACAPSSTPRQATPTY
jgi:hypothetical protein